jgi:hypothetical protein
MLKPQLKEKLWKEYTSLGADALKANHYTLAITTTEHNPAVWKEFLMEQDVSDYITQETALLQQAEFRSILLNTARDNSAGRAQLINAMMSVSQKQNKKEGPIIIYSYIPLNEQQLKASNIEINEKDPFKR